MGYLQAIQTSAIDHYSVTNNIVEDVTITAYRDVGGVIGSVPNSSKAPVIQDNKVTDLTIIVDQKTNTYGDEEANAGKGLKFPKWIRFYVAYILPVIIIVLFIIGMVNFPWK